MSLSLSLPLLLAFMLNLIEVPVDMQLECTRAQLLQATRHWRAKASASPPKGVFRFRLEGESLGSPRVVLRFARVVSL